jgi:hypothetical protein
MNMNYVNLPPKNIRPETVERPLWLNSCVLLEEQDDNETTDPFFERIVQEKHASAWREEQI